MPEIKHTFSAGRMNKDLDERLLPNGEYRDAMNIQVSGSEGSNVGAVTNILGTTSRSSHSIAGAKCIGVIADSQNEKIYWFICGTTISAIAEYDQLANEVNPVVVDSDNSRLKFDKTKLITGVNIIDGLLYWTDNNSEPKVINIERFKDGVAASNIWSTTTVLTKTFPINTTYTFKEDDITVIKKGPITSPTIDARSTKRQFILGLTGIIETVVSENFDDGSGNPRPVDYEITVAEADIIGPRPTLVPGDVVLLVPQDIDAVEDVFDEDAYIRCEVLDPFRLIAVTGLNNDLKLKILSIPDSVPASAVNWTLTLEQGEPMFQDKFIRFSYRWKYRDNEYSTFAPWSEAVYVPKTFEYNHEKGYNLGMENELRYIKISDFRNSDLHEQVDEIDILYKDDTGTNVYVVDTIKPTDAEWGLDEYELESEIIYKTVQSNQLLRPFDNVPKKAKAQELVGNRIVYGNYLQNFDMPSDFAPRFTVQQDLRGVAEEKEPEKSVKSMREYQVGVVYKDTLGRETPVFTHSSGGIRIDKIDAVNYNQLKVKNDFESPKDGEGNEIFSHYKFYIKEPSNEYYNLGMDRWYPAEDGNVWISFPSSERNKIKEGGFIELKKKHAGDGAVADPAKYKVIAIENEAPSYIKEKEFTLGVASAQDWSADGQSAWVPIVNGNTLRILEDKLIDESNFTKEETLTKTGLRLRLTSDAGRSNWYEIKKFKLVGSGAGAYYEIEIKSMWGQDIEVIFASGHYQYDDAATGNGMGTDLGLELAEIKEQRLPEFQGRFFVKLHRDGKLNSNVLSTQEVTEYKISKFATIQRKTTNLNDTQWRDWMDNDVYDREGFISESIGGTNNDQVDHPGWAKSKYFYGNKLIWWGLMNSEGRNNSGPDGIYAGNTYITIALLWQFNPKDPYKQFIDGIKIPGAKFRIREEDGTPTYTVEDSLVVGVNNYSTTDRKRKWPSNKRTVIVLKLDKPIASFNESDYAEDWGTGSSSHTHNNPFNIDLLEEIEPENFSTDNPAIFETYPEEDLDVDLYYEASDAIAIADHGTAQVLDYHNCYSFGNGVESNRVRDDFNAGTIAKGVKVSSILEEPYKEERRKSGLIFSQIYNSISGVNRLNQFIQAEAITKDLNPEYGSIQKLHQRDSDLIALCEDKVIKILANKDALFEAGGNAQLTANNRVLGQSMPYVGDYGISQNPESFASFGFRAYFADKARGAIMRLSRDGLTEISMHGMVDYFRDKLAIVDTIVGSYDDNKDLYNVTFTTDNGNAHDDTVSFKEMVGGWTSRKSFIPESALSLNNIYYSLKNGELWSHDNEIRNTFYGTGADYFTNSSLTAVLNDYPGLIKSFKTLNYEGTQSRVVAEGTAGEMSFNLDNRVAENGWWASTITTNIQSGTVPEFIEKENKWFNFIQGDATTLPNLDTQEFSVQGIGDQLSMSGDTQANVVIKIEENAD